MEDWEIKYWARVVGNYEMRVWELMREHDVSGTEEIEMLNKRIREIETTIWVGSYQAYNRFFLERNIFLAHKLYPPYKRPVQVG